MEQTVLQWVHQYGAPALFMLMALGVFGLPIPDETLLVIAGLLINHGELKATPTAMASVGGAMTGISVSYAFGRFAGTRVLTRYGSVFRIDQAMIERAHGWFERLGKWLLTIGYFIPGVRHFTAIVAGASGLSGVTFAIFAYSGAVTWVSCFLTIGYFVGDKWPEYIDPLHQHIGLAVTAMVLVAAAYWMFVHRSSSASDSSSDGPQTRS